MDVERQFDLFCGFLLLWSMAVFTLGFVYGDEAAFEAFIISGFSAGAMMVYRALTDD